MENYIAVDKDNTKLTQYGLTYGHVLDGRKAELEPENKIKRKEDYILSETVNTILGDYADDLLEAYQSNESMEEYIEEMEDDLDDAVKAFDQSQEQVKALMQSQGELSAIETAMATLDQQMEQLAEDRRNGKTENEKLKSELQVTLGELEEEKSRINQISEQVDSVLSNLQIYLDEEGIIMEDDDEEY